MASQIPMRFETEPLLWLVDDVYTEGECRNFIDFIEQSSPTLATNNPLYRDQDRSIEDNPKIAEDLPLFCHSGKIKIRAKFLTVDRASI